MSARLPHSDAEADPNSTPAAVNILVRVVATASPRGRQRLRRSARFLTDGGDLAAAFEIQTSPAIVESESGAEHSGRRPTPLNDNIRTDVVEPFGLLHQLAPLHKGNLAKRAMTATGLDGVATLEDLGAALVLSSVRPVQRNPRRVIRGGKWVVDLLDLPPPGIDIPAAQVRYDRLDRLRPAAVWLKTLADAANVHPHAKDSRLAAMPEEDMAKAAEDHADRWVAIMAYRKLRAPGPMTSTERRLCCPKHWRRALRRRAAAARQYWCSVLQLAGGPEEQGNPSFCDDYTLERWMERQTRAEEYGKLKVWVSDQGDRVLMADVMKASQVGALNRLYILCVGHEELARRAGLVPIFITVTLPSAYHPNPKEGAPRPGLDLSADPKAADRALGALWDSLRWRLKGLHIEKLGLRVVEAHDYGCPHLHALLYVRPEDVDAVDDVLQAIRPEPVAGKRIATKLIRIDQTRARAVSYIMKYIVKSLNLSPEAALRERGLDAAARQDLRNADHIEIVAALHRAEPEDDPFAHDDHLVNFNRVRAWASERNIRRYSLLGTHGVQGIWQRLWTQRNPMGRAAPRAMRQAWIAMHRETRDERQAAAEFRRLSNLDGADPQALREAWATWQSHRHGRIADALVWLGRIQHSAIIDPDTPRARIGYATTETRTREHIDWETGEVTDETAEFPLVNSYGEAIRKPVSVVFDGAAGWSLPLKRKLWTLGDATEEDQQLSNADRAAQALANALKKAANTFIDKGPSGSIIRPVLLAVEIPDGTNICLMYLDQLCGQPANGPPDPPRRRPPSMFAYLNAAA